MVNPLIPAAGVATLQVPELALTTGGTDVVWHDRTWGRMRWSRRNVIGLPYDPAAAARLRNYGRLNKFYLVFLPVYAILSGLWVLQDGRLVLASGWRPLCCSSSQRHSKPAGT